MSKILFITEGKRPEDKIIDSFKSHLGYEPKKRYEFEWGIWSAGILDLCSKLTKDPYLDYLPLLCEKDVNKHLEGYSVDDFAQIFLFFDLDPQVVSSKGVNNFYLKIKGILAKCHDETLPCGKLFLSYPMIEAYLSFPYEKECSLQECFFTEDTAKAFPAVISSINTSPAKHNKFNDNFWKKLFSFHIQKACLFLNSENTYDDVCNINQLLLFESQLEFCKKKGCFFALSPVGFFLLSIYGETFYEMLDFSNLFCECNCLKNFSHYRDLL